MQLLFAMFTDDRENSEMHNVTNAEISESCDHSLERLDVNDDNGEIVTQTENPSSDLPENSQSISRIQSPHESNTIHLNAVRAAETIVSTCLKHVGKSL